MKNLAIKSFNYIIYMLVIGGFAFSLQNPVAAQGFSCKNFQKNQNIDALKQDAINQYRLSAEQGDAKAQFNLARQYDFGNRWQANLTEAFKWYQKSAEQGHVNAQLHLAEFYEKGKRIGLEIEKDDALAFSWYKKAADQNNAQAQLKLGDMYRFGRGTKLNKQQALYWYQKAAEHEDPAVDYELSRIYENDINYNNFIDLDKALFLLKKSANNGYATAQAQLGYEYQTGKRVEQNYQQALDWYFKAAGQNNSFAQYHIGEMYDLGLGFHKDLAKAAIWYQKSAKSGDVDAFYAQSMLIGMYEKGLGVKKDYTKAYIWSHIISLVEGKYPSAKDILASKLSKKQVRQAELAAQRCICTGYKDCPL
ncbi:tetratricopeptide repeat protein [Bartonella sp. HY761]|uniref:tetratricopeptide repeat protein n=1 Tax=Bartonella sp. HY761 TaxID=2979330 RepID=UPI0021FD8650|nr:tetratricopeptide repeat protein [Bartonella sp. HY761]UXN06226.1 sel1 repeat family protein [Bartonella sp. HY761]